MLLDDHIWVRMALDYGRWGLALGVIAKMLLYDTDCSRWDFVIGMITCVPGDELGWS